MSPLLRSLILSAALTGALSACSTPGATPVTPSAPATSGDVTFPKLKVPVRQPGEISRTVVRLKADGGLDTATTVHDAETGEHPWLLTGACVSSPPGSPLTYRIANASVRSNVTDVRRTQHSGRVVCDGKPFSDVVRLGHLPVMVDFGPSSDVVSAYAIVVPQP